MTLTLKEFKNKYLGKQVEFHSYGAGALNQCVDLINAYINKCLDNNTKDYTEIIGTNAKDFRTKFDPKDFDFIENTQSPNVFPLRGDIGIMNGHVGGGVGHVFIVEEADGSTIKSLDQNWSEVERVTEETHNYTNVSGWLRPRMQGSEALEKMTGSRDNWRKACGDFENELKVSKHLNKTLSSQVNTLQTELFRFNENITEFSLLGKRIEVRITTIEEVPGGGVSIA